MSKNQLKMSNVRFLSESMVKLQKVEMAFNVKGFEGNPFDSDEIDIVGEFVSSTGAKLTMPAFWYQDFKRSLEPVEEPKALEEQRGISGMVSIKDDEIQGIETLTAQGMPEWRIRFSPTEKGTWRYVIVLKVKGELLDTVEGDFNVEDVDSAGYLRVEPTRKRHLMFENGERYIPVGENVCWWTSPTRRSYDYDIWFNELAENGGNFARLWMATWGFALVWKETPVDDYTNRLDRAYQLDKVMELAEEKGIYIMLAVLNHGQFSAKTNPEWDDNPYNVKNGGYLKHPSEFFTDERAAKQFKKRLRYIAARWGYSTHVMSWEFWNEVNWTDNYDGEAVKEWHQEMAHYIREIDPYKHLVSTSSGALADPVFEVEEMDFINLHGYGLKNWCIDIPGYQRKYAEKFDKPVLFSEMGIDWRGGVSTRQADPQGIHIHQGLWAGVMGNGVGTGMTWWWDSYIHPANLYHHFKPIRTFVEQMVEAEGVLEEIPGKDWSLSDERAGLYGYKSAGERFLWVYDKEYTHESEHPQPFQEIELELDVENGRYQVSWFDTYQGAVIQEEVISISNGCLSMKMPEWKGDIAIIAAKQD